MSARQLVRAVHAAAQAAGIAKRVSPQHDQIVNAPLRAGDGGEAFREAMEVAICRALKTSRPATPMGFCFFNNAAIAARHAERIWCISIGLPSRTDWPRVRRARAARRAAAVGRDKSQFRAEIKGVTAASIATKHRFKSRAALDKRIPHRHLRSANEAVEAKRHRQGAISPIDGLWAAESARAPPR